MSPYRIVTRAAKARQAAKESAETAGNKVATTTVSIEPTAFFAELQVEYAHQHQLLKAFQSLFNEWQQAILDDDSRGQVERSFQELLEANSRIKEKKEVVTTIEQLYWVVKEKWLDIFPHDVDARTRNATGNAH